MAWPWLAVIAKNVPWVELARRAPDIWAASRQLLDESRRGVARTPQRSPTLEERVEILEQRDAEHARLLAAMVEQLQSLTEVVHVLRTRNKLLSLVVAALLVALAVQALL